MKTIFSKLWRKSSKSSLQVSEQAKKPNGKYKKNIPIKFDKRFLASYIPGALLGQGAFGFVLAAERRSDGTKVAVKFIDKELIRPEGWAKDDELGIIPFEVFVVKSFSHPNIVKYFDYGEDERYCYLITELHGSPWTTKKKKEDLKGFGELDISSVNQQVETLETQTLEEVRGAGIGTKAESVLDSWQPNALGRRITSTSVPILTESSEGQLLSQKAFSFDMDDHNFETPHWNVQSLDRHSSHDLFECIEVNGALPTPVVKKVFRQIVSAVQYLHSLGYVHKDLKDENIVIDSDYTIKLVDFGSCARIPHDPKDYFGVFNGTLHYAPPEVLQGNTFRGPEAEVWTLGILLYLLLTNDCPFHDIDAVIFGKLEAKVSLDASCLSLLNGMLAKRPEHRLSIDQVADHPWLLQNIES